MTNRLAVDDAFYTDMRIYFKNTGEKTAMQLEELTKNIRSVCALGVQDGETAEALRLFLERASSLSELALSFSNEAARLMESFDKTINEVDGRLYD